MIAEVAGFPFFMIALCAGGAFACAYVVGRHHRGDPVLPLPGEPFHTPLPPGIGLLALAFFLVYSGCGILATTGQSRGSAIVGVVLPLAFTALVYATHLRRTLRPRGTPVERAGLGLLAVWAALPLIYIAFLFMKTLGLEQEQPQVEQMSEGREGWQIVALYAVVVAPIAEEVCFRGLLYPLVRAARGPRFAVATTAAAFGLIHYVPATIVPLTIFGIVLARLVEATGSLLPCIVAHMAFNGLTVAQLAF